MLTGAPRLGAPSVLCWSNLSTKASSTMNPRGGCESTSNARLISPRTRTASASRCRLASLPGAMRFVFPQEARRLFDGQARARASLVDVIMSISHGCFSAIGGKNYNLADKVRLSEHNLTTVELNQFVNVASKQLQVQLNRPCKAL